MQKMRKTLRDIEKEKEHAIPKFWTEIWHQI